MDVLKIVLVAAPDYRQAKSHREASLEVLSLSLHGDVCHDETCSADLGDDSIADFLVLVPLSTRSGSYPASLMAGAMPLEKAAFIDESNDIAMNTTREFTPVTHSFAHPARVTAPYTPSGPTNSGYLPKGTFVGLGVSISPCFANAST